MAVGLAVWAFALTVTWRVLAYESGVRQRKSAARRERMKPA
jgi:hypothetical protein